MKIGDKVLVVGMLIDQRSTGQVSKATVIALRETDFAVEVAADDLHAPRMMALRDYADEGRTWVHGWEDNFAFFTVAALQA